jgi:hypothetical protein
MAAADFIRRAFGWSTLGPGLVAAVAVTVVAFRMTQPAFDVARACTTIAAVLLAVRVLAWVAVKGATFGREERLLAFVMLAAVGLGWIGMGEWTEDRAFDFRVAQQKAELSTTLHDMSMRITQFCNARDRMAPPHPRPATWQQDVDEYERFEADTVRAYEGRFGPRVRAVHDLASLRGLRDRDLDAFFRHPANEFQMRVIAKKLDSFSRKLSSSTGR